VTGWRAQTQEVQSERLPAIRSTVLFADFILMNTSDIINGLKHTADDHPCCGETIGAAISKLKELEEGLGAMSYHSIKLQRENSKLRDALTTADRAIVAGQACRSEAEFTRWMNDSQQSRPHADLTSANAKDVGLAPSTSPENKNDEN